MFFFLVNFAAHYNKVFAVGFLAVKNRILMTVKYKKNHE